MKLQENDWIEKEERWVPYEESKTYQNHILKETEVKDYKDVNNMEVEIHNELDINYKKSMNIVSFFTKSVLGKFAKKKAWKLEVWLEEKKSKNSPSISCGVALIRPKKNTVYAKRAAGSLKEALKQSIRVVERTIRNEGTVWEREKLNQHFS